MTEDVAVPNEAMLGVVAAWAELVEEGGEAGAEAGLGDP